MLFDLILLGVGCLLLFGGGEWLVRGASATGERMGLSPAAVGMVLVSLGTSAPELFVGVGAALQGFGDIAVGNVVGSNIVNMCIVLGLAFLLADLSFDRAMRHRQLPFLLLLTAVAAFLLLDGELGRLEGLLLLAGAVVGLMWALRSSGSGEFADSGNAGATTTSQAAMVGGEEAQSDVTMSSGKAIGILVGGVIMLAAGAEALILGGVALAEDLKVPEAFIALTVTSIGTGLPEIVATVIAALRGKSAIALGNVIGSNIMNLGLVLGGSAVLTPLTSRGIDGLSLGLMLVLSAALGALSWYRRAVPRLVGLALLIGYAIYVVVLAG